MNQTNRQKDRQEKIAHFLKFVKFLFCQPKPSAGFGKLPKFSEILSA
jgi:hypothetical protein